MLEVRHKENLRREGFSIFSGLIPNSLVDNALRAINRRLAVTDMRQEARAYGFMEDLTLSQELTDLYHRSSLRDLCASIVGRRELEAVDRAQIALRFPQPKEEAQKASLPWHLDGMYNSEFGAVPDPINFTLLAGVFLSDLPSEDCGNFTVYPGGHEILAKSFRQHGFEALNGTLHGLDGTDPRPLRTRRGDVVVCHHQVPHLEEPPNRSPHIRYAVFFRVNWKGRPLCFEESMTNPLVEWEGLGDAG